MNYEVMKPFNTVPRRLGVGSEISTDEPIEPFTFEERLTSGFIKEPEPVMAISNDSSPKSGGVDSEPADEVAVAKK